MPRISHGPEKDAELADGHSARWRCTSTAVARAATSRTSLRRLLPVRADAPAALPKPQEREDDDHQPGLLPSWPGSGDRRGPSRLGCPPAVAWNVTAGIRSPSRSALRHSPAPAARRRARNMTKASVCSSAPTLCSPATPADDAANSPVAAQSAGGSAGVHAGGHRGMRNDNRYAPFLIAETMSASAVGGGTAAFNQHRLFDLT